jgi:hypothetical protein
MTTSTLPPGLIRRSQFRHLIPFATNTIKKMIEAGKFPPPDARASGPRLYIWHSEVIEAYLNGTWTK